MKRLSVIRPFAASLIVLHVMAYCMPAAHAAPGTLATSPLFLSTAVEPNILFLLDDSGSMEWETLVGSNSSGVPTIGGISRYYDIPTADNGADQYYTANYCSTCYPFTTPSTTLAPDAWRARNSSYNTLYYNPAITYKPWPGANSSGNSLYTDASPTAAPLDPARPSVGTVDLTQPITYTNYTSSAGWVTDTIYPATYYTWTDTNATASLANNGIVDATDTHTQVQIVSSNDSYPKAATRTDCAGTTCTYAEEIQNFANWYSYHRKRNFSAKAAMGSVINGSTNDRMGLELYNGGLVSNAADMNTASNKRALLQDTYNLNIQCNTSSCPGTPARTALKAVGDLFSGSNSPILSATDGGTCQQNFDVVMTDGYWNGPSPNVGNTDGDDDTSFDGPPYADPYSNTLADVAMQYYEHDLKTGLANDVPVIPGVDTATFQHLVTYTVGLGVNGTLNPATADPTSSTFSWPDPFNGSPQKIDDLWHAAYDARGGFYNAQDPDQLTNALGSTIQGISNRTSSAAAVAFNSTNLGTNSFVYQAQFNTAHWSGQLLAFALDPNNGTVSTTATWNTATVLDARDLSTDPRTILTYNSTTGTGIPFEWSNLTTAEQSDLRTNSAGGTDSATVGQERLAYLRGDRSLEGSPFRVRGSRLGDIIHSNPVYVGSPDMGYGDTAPFPSATGSTYSDFKNSEAGRENVIYVGGNDGMLHGFDAGSGAEVFGYIPSNLFSTASGAGLHYLTDPNYSHHYYVDLSPTVSDAYTMTSPSDTAPHWATVLVGGERAGGRGLFALDVTNPSNFSESGTAPQSTVMWQFTNQDDPDLGYTFSQPTIAMTNAVDGSGNHRWAAIFGNGYNDTGSGQAELFILFLDGGLDGNWTSSGDYIKITTGVGSSSNPNGLSTPLLVDTNGDGTVDRVYAGDLQGNLWAFDLSNASSSNWGAASTQGGTPQPLFTATDSSGTPQPITAKPIAVVNPSVASSTSPSNLPNLLVYFGTGEYLVSGDKTSTGTQSFYGVWDDGSKNLTRANLVQQTFQSGFPSDVRVPTDNPVDYSSQYGWYMDLPDTGERVVTNAKVRGDLVFFNTLIPDNEPCSFGGTGWLMSVQQANGGPPKTAAFDFNNDLVVNDADMVTQSGSSTAVAPGGHTFTQGIPAQSNFLGDHQYTPGSNGQIQHDVVNPGGSSYIGRLSWREIRF